MAEQEWAGTTYGNEWMHKWLIRMLRYIDVRILYLFVALFIIPVCLVLNPSRGIAYRYFRQRIGYGRMKSAWKTYVNHCLFGQVVVDKFAMYAGKKFEIKPMYPEDACMQMDLLGHNFYVFINAETDQVNVVYKRKGDTYGLIEPEI